MSDIMMIDHMLSLFHEPDYSFGNCARMCSNLMYGSGWYENRTIHNMDYLKNSFTWPGSLYRRSVALQIALKRSTTHANRFDSFCSCWACGR